VNQFSCRLACHAGVRVTLPNVLLSSAGFVQPFKTPKKPAMAALGPEQAALYGISMNENNGICSHGYAFDVEKKLSVKVSYQRFKEANRGLRPNLTHVARDCEVSPDYMKKIENELRNHGRVVHPDENKSERLGLVHSPVALWIHSPCWFCTS
jgi:hypothetical protein